MTLEAKTLYHVQCDTPGCDEGTPDFEAIHECKQYMQDEGWSGDTFESYCPDCTDEVQRQHNIAQAALDVPEDEEMSEEEAAIEDQAHEDQEPEDQAHDETDKPKKGGKHGKADNPDDVGLESEGKLGG